MLLQRRLSGVKCIGIRLDYAVLLKCISCLCGVYLWIINYHSNVYLSFCVSRLRKIIKEGHSKSYCRFDKKKKKE